MTAPSDPVHPPHRPRRRAPRQALTLALALALVGCGEAEGPATSGPVDLVIEGVTVVDAVHGARAGQTVAVADGRIVAVLDDAEAGGIEAAERVDGRGRTLIPGLWDFHVHFTYDARFTEAMSALFLAHGVTSVRDTGGVLELLLPVIETLRGDDVVAPRVYYSGPLLDGADVVYEGVTLPALGIATPDVETARAHIATLADAGATFVKVYEMLDPDVFAALADEATARGLPIAGHVPLSMLARDVGPRVQSLEHLRNLELDCAAGADSLLAVRRTLLANPEGVPGGDLRARLHAEQRVPAILDRDDGRCAAVIQSMQGTLMVPTLRLNAMGLASPLDRDDWWAALELVPGEAAEAWRAQGTRERGGGPLRDTVHGAFSMQMVGELYAAGVPIAAGTDTPIGYAIPGHSLLTEVELLVEAGLPPLEALRAATVRPAEFFGLDDELGVVAAGYLADLVLLEGNPLDDIAHIRGVEAVVTRGRLFTRAELERRLR